MRTTPGERHEAVELGRKWIAEQPPLADPIALARPIVDAFRELYYAFEGRSEALEFDYELNEPQAVQAGDVLVDTVDEVVAIVRAHIHMWLVGEDRGTVVPSMIDPIIRAITNVEPIAHLRAVRRYDETPPA